MERREKTERLAVEHRRTIGDERAGAMSDDDDALGRQRLESGAHAGAADADGADQFAFSRQSLAALERAGHDQATDVTRHQFRGDTRAWTDNRGE